MRKHVYLTLVSTLFIGFFSGIYMYFLTREPNVPKEITPVEEDAGFEVIANRYGGCERVGCTLYRIHEDGTYMFLKYNSGSEGERFQDSVTETQRENLRALLADTDFVGVKELVFTGICPTTYDGIAYRYEITYEGETYSFNSCEEDLENEPLFIELKNYFDIFRLIHGVL